MNYRQAKRNGQTCHYERDETGQWWVVWSSDFGDDKSGKEKVDGKTNFLLNCGFYEGLNYGKTQT